MSSSIDLALRWLRTGYIEPDAFSDPRGLDPDEAMAQRALAFANTFRGRDGQIVLETILEASLFRPPVDGKLTGKAYYRHAQTREGQNQLAAMILAYLEKAETLERTSTNEHASISSPPHPGPGGDGERGEPSGGWSAIDGLLADPRRTDPDIAVR